MRIFPEVFDPTAFQGPRGRQFQRREDAFQQLVGDGLRELHGGLGVSVSTTRGVDGSIDVWIEAVNEGDSCLPALPKPLIVECKDHEEVGSKLRKKLFGGWREVANTLTRRAAAGWPGPSAPWRSARSYAYCVSARLPTPELRLTLRDEIRGFFERLPSGVRPPIESIEVLDWSNLRALWDGVPRLADRWLGIGVGVEMESLLSHAEQVKRFTGFRAYLLEEKLPFLAPAADDPAHPDALLARLSEAGRERGLLLEGPGGVGKSRTLVEVSVRADAAGWRVLHGQSEGSVLTDEFLEETVLSGLGSTLVILDYLDKMQLDLTRLRQRLLPEAAARGIRLAVLANSRPGALDRHSDQMELFEVVPLRPTSVRARAIAGHVLATAAPNALKRLGVKRLTERITSPHPVGEEAPDRSARCGVHLADV